MSKERRLATYLSYLEKKHPGFTGSPGHKKIQQAAQKHADREKKKKAIKESRLDELSRETLEKAKAKAEVTPQKDVRAMKKIWQGIVWPVERRLSGERMMPKKRGGYRKYHFEEGVTDEPFGKPEIEKSGTYSGGGSATLSFDSASAIKVGEEIEVALTGALTSTQGAGLEAPFVFRFRVETIGGTGVFDDVQTVPGQTNAIALAAGDWDGDGDLDLAVANFGSNSVTILKNDGTGRFTASPFTVDNQQGATALAAGEWDGDGDLDLAVADFGSDSIGILENDGTGVFTFASTVFNQLGVKALASGDWDGDGDLDLAAADFSANRVAILKNDGAGNFTVSSSITGQTNTQN